MSVRFRDLGTLQLDRGEQSVPVVGRRLTVLLGFLLVRATQRVSADALSEAVWGTEQLPDGARLDAHVWRLRRLVEPEHRRGAPFRVLINDAGGYRLLAGPEQVDSLLFEQLAGRLRDLADSRPAQTRDLAEQALALWRGSPWGPHTEESWAAPAAARLVDLRSEVTERRIEALLELGEAPLALADLGLLLAEQPLRERLWALRMLAAYRSGSTEEALATYTRARRVLADEVGVDPGPELAQLHARILDEDPALAGPRPVAPRPGPGTDEPRVVVRLPPQRVRLLGRDQDSAALSALVQTRPLVTVVGAAGCGKTSLAIQVARDLADRHPDGVYFVDLTVSTQDQVAQTVASTLGVATSVGTGDVPAGLARVVEHRRMLIVLDNCEHVLDAAAQLVDVILGAAGGPTVLATSREALDVDGETVLALSPLAIPEPDLDGEFDLDPENIDDEPAVALFVERLQAGSPLTVVGRAEIGQAARICAALDGLPLAIELAASQARSFSLVEIADRVRADPAGLARVGRGGQRHHASLRGTIESSSAALAADERAMLQAVAVVPGPFTGDLAAALADTTPAHARDLLSGLVHRSMLSSLGPREEGRPSRFAQLATIRAYALGTLAEDELKTIEGRRDRWIRDLVAEVPELGHRSELGWHGRLDDDLSAVRAMLHRTLVEQPDPIGAFVAARLGHYWYYRSMNIEWERWVGLGAASRSADPTDRLICAISRVGARNFLGRSAPGAAELADAVERLDPNQAMVPGLYLLSVSLSAKLAGDDETSVRFADTGTRLAAATESAHLDLLAQTARALSSGGIVPPQDRLAAADRIYRRAVEMDNLFVMQTVATSGTSASFTAGQVETGLRWSERSLTLAAVLGVGASGYVAELRGAHLMLAGRVAEAVETLAAAENLARWAGRSWPTYPMTKPMLSRARETLPAADYLAAERRGRSLTVDQLAARASASLGQLGPEAPAGSTARAGLPAGTRRGRAGRNSS